MQAQRKLFLASAVAAVLALAACGPAGSGSGAQSINPTVSGAVSANLSASRIVLRDSADPAQERSTAPLTDGTYSIDVSGLTAPFVLRAEGDAGTYYAIVDKAGNADINELTTTAAMAACAREGQDAGQALSGSGWREGATRIGSVIQALRTVLKPLFDCYVVTRIGGDDDEGDVSGMRALLRDVSFGVQSGTVTVTNRATGKIIFTGSLKDLASGTFSAENLPAKCSGGTPATCTSFTYSDWSPTPCTTGSEQTRTVLTSSPAGCTGGTPVTSQTCQTTPPPTCTSWTYSAWAPDPCAAGTTQTRNVLTSSPAGCTGGTPALNRACPTAPPPPTCTSWTYSAWTPDPCAAGTTQTRNVLSSLPAGCTGGSPVLTQTCTAPPLCTYTTGTWGACQPNGTRTRTVTASPAGCTPNNPPATSEQCTYVPPTCTSWTYSTWSACVNGSQTRAVTSSLPAGCTGGTPGPLTQSCMPPPDGAALYTQYCSGCHGAAPGSRINIPKANRSVTAINSFNMSQGLNATDLQAVVDYLNTFP